MGDGQFRSVAYYRFLTPSLNMAVILRGNQTIKTSVLHPFRTRQIFE